MSRNGRRKPQSSAASLLVSVLEPVPLLPEHHLMNKNGSVSRKASTVKKQPGHGGNVTSNPTATCSGGPRQTQRSRWWKAQREKAVAWERAFKAKRQKLLQAGQMSLHSEQYCQSLEDILCRIKFGAEKWIKRIWNRLRQQYKTASISVMTKTIRKVMTENDSSGLYQLFSFDMSRIYTGLCKERPMCERFVEHLTRVAGHCTLPTTTETESGGVR